MTPLHQLGDWLRAGLLAIPLPAARGVFLALLGALLVWVLLLPVHATRPPAPRPGRWSEDLKIWAAAALVIQILIYGFL